ncbi:MAG: alginate export family protein, partial [Gammaproteobacteria bacterium]|nr:alginate export family protein [Gammaproteobacteria bacterium]
VPDQWAMNYYLAYQFGQYDDSRDSDISAYAAFGEFKYALFPRINTPIFGLKTSYFSGDHNPNDDELNTFYNPIFVTVYFTYARNVMPYNLIHLQPNIGYRFSEKLHVSLSNDFLWRANKDDAFYTGASKIGVSADASDSRYIGSQTQLSMNWQPTPSIVASMHLVRFWRGGVVKDAGGDNQNYARLNVSYLF